MRRASSSVVSVVGEKYSRPCDEPTGRGKSPRPLVAGDTASRILSLTKHIATKKAARGATVPTQRSTGRTEAAGSGVLSRCSVTFDAPTADYFAAWGRRHAHSHSGCRIHRHWLSIRSHAWDGGDGFAQNSLKIAHGRSRLIEAVLRFCSGRAPANWVENGYQKTQGRARQ